LGLKGNGLQFQAELRRAFLRKTFILSGFSEIQNHSCVIGGRPKPHIRDSCRQSGKGFEEDEGNSEGE
jgi:hypothetical protein